MRAREIVLKSVTHRVGLFQLQCRGWTRPVDVDQATRPQAGVKEKQS